MLSLMEFAKKFQLDQAMTGVAPVFELQTCAKSR